MDNKKTFRFDDVCINSDLELLQQMTDFLYERYPDCNVVYGVSPLVHDMKDAPGKERQRVFPKINNAYSDIRINYCVDHAGIPLMDNRVIKAGHGIVHVDHRLLSYELQEASILISCSLSKSKIFIPPFNKWNSDSEKICFENGISLIKFEEGWLSMEHNSFDEKHDLWYLHAREFNIYQFKKWFNG